jgi:hypothetical protein
MYYINTDIQKNFLYITLKGVLSREDFDQLENMIINKIKPLKAGFSVINDVSGLDSDSEMVAGQIMDIHKLFVRNSIKQIVLISGEHVIDTIFEHISRDTGVVWHRAKSVQEAENLLLSSK